MELFININNILEVPKSLGARLMCSSQRMRNLENFDAPAAPGILVDYCKCNADRVLTLGVQEITDAKDVTFGESVSASTEDQEITLNLVLQTQKSNFLIVRILNRITLESHKM